MPFIPKKAWKIIQIKIIQYRHDHVLTEYRQKLIIFYTSIHKLGTSYIVTNINISIVEESYQKREN